MEEQNKSNSVAIAALCCGIACFFINPLYLTCLAAIILGIVGLCKPGKKLLAGLGLGLGIAGTIAQFIVDCIITVLSFGVGMFTFFI